MPTALTPPTSLTHTFRPKLLARPSLLTALLLFWRPRLSLLFPAHRRQPWLHLLLLLRLQSWRPLPTPTLLVKPSLSTTLLLSCPPRLSSLLPPQWSLPPPPPQWLLLARQPLMESHTLSKQTRTTTEPNLLLRPREIPKLPLRCASTLALVMGVASQLHLTLRQKSASTSAPLS